MSDAKPPQDILPKPIPPLPCAHVTGILFSRKTCGAMTSLRCGRCHSAICDKHAWRQAGGLQYCHACDAYENDDRSWSSSSTDTYRSSSQGTSTAPVAAGAGAGAAGGALGDDDRAGLTQGQGWHGDAPPDGASADDSGFDAS